MTSALAQDLRGVAGHHLLNLVLAEVRLEQLLRKNAKPLVGPGIVGLAEVAGEDRAAGADGANVLDHLVPRDLARVGGGEAALEEHPVARELLLLIEGQ